MKQSGLPFITGEHDSTEEFSPATLIFLTSRAHVVSLVGCSLALVNNGLLPEKSVIRVDHRFFLKRAISPECLRVAT